LSCVGPESSSPQESKILRNIAGFLVVGGTENEIPGRRHMEIS
jgi:hypothetical protein